jgi:hypothetical protein
MVMCTAWFKVLWSWWCMWQCVGNQDPNVAWLSAGAGKEKDLTHLAGLPPVRGTPTWPTDSPTRPTYLWPTCQLQLGRPTFYNSTDRLFNNPAGRLFDNSAGRLFTIRPADFLQFDRPTFYNSTGRLFDNSAGRLFTIRPADFLQFDRPTFYNSAGRLFTIRPADFLQFDRPTF